MKRIVPKKNYIILILLIILVVAACFAAVNIFNIYQTNKISTSPLENKSVLYSDLKNAVKDLDADTFLVISYLNDKNVYNNEKEIKKFLESKNLIDNVLYLNVTEYKNDEGFVEELNSTLNLDKKIEKLPAVVFYQDNKITTIIDSKKQLLNKSDFEQITDLYINQKVS